MYRRLNKKENRGENTQITRRKRNNGVSSKIREGTAQKREVGTFAMDEKDALKGGNTTLTQGGVGGGGGGGS